MGFRRATWPPPPPSKKKNDVKKAEIVEVSTQDQKRAPELLASHAASASTPFETVSAPMITASSLLFLTKNDMKKGKHGLA